MQIRARLYATDQYGVPDTLSYEHPIASFRVFPCPPATVTPSAWQIEGTYKKRHTKVTPDNINSLVLPWDDQHFEVFRKVLEWRALDEIGSPAAGQMTFHPEGSVTANGAAASALSAVTRMTAREGVNDPPEQLAPESEIFL